MTVLRAPFPYFGGKSRVAAEVWRRFGTVRNYVEPFAGSLAVLLARPGGPITETVNDADALIANFWRAVRHNPEAVARWADYPVSELDLIARHRWLCRQDEMLQQVKDDPGFYDVKVAGWWVWGKCGWIGAGWCELPQHEKLPHLGDPGMGINRKLPHLGDPGMGINRKLPHLGDPGRSARLDYIVGELTALADRLRDVRIACGDWTRVTGPTVTWRFGLTAVFLDPPYAGAEHCVDYGRADVWPDVCQWCEENGDNPLLRIALCGYADTWRPPDSWESLAWKAAGGYGSQGNGRGRDNAGRERIWFSPACVGGTMDLPLFAGLEATP